MLENDSKKLFLIGVDEVGRGSIAGPVAVGVFVFLNKKAKRIFRGVKESKQLTEKRREEWFTIIGKTKKEGQTDFHVSFQSKKTIDTKGISYAIKKALNDSLDGLCSRIGTNISRLHVLLDGGLKASPKYKNQKTIIRGDEKKIVIALASICAKVARDKKMISFGKEYPRYGFEIHKGYGTKRHYEAIRKYGPCPLHRLTFL